MKGLFKHCRKLSLHTKIYNNSKLFKNTFVFLEGEHISNSLTSVLKRLDKMGFKVFDNNVPENIEELESFFNSLKYITEENHVKDYRENVVFLKSSFLTPIIYYPNDETLFEKGIKYQKIYSEKYLTKIFPLFCDDIEAKTRVAYHSYPEYENQNKMNLERLEKIPETYERINKAYNFFGNDQIVYTTDVKQSIYYIMDFLNIKCEIPTLIYNSNDQKS